MIDTFFSYQEDKLINATHDAMMIKKYNKLFSEFILKKLISWPNTYVMKFNFICKIEQEIKSFLCLLFYFHQLI